MRTIVERGDAEFHSALAHDDELFGDTAAGLARFFQVGDLVHFLGEPTRLAGPWTVTGWGVIRHDRVSVDAALLSHPLAPCTVAIAVTSLYHHREPPGRAAAWRLRAARARLWVSGRSAL